VGWLNHTTSSSYIVTTVAQARLDEIDGGVLLHHDEHGHDVVVLLDALVVMRHCPRCRREMPISLAAEAPFQLHLIISNFKPRGTASTTSAHRARSS
jgi:hypothetical protein